MECWATFAMNAEEAVKALVLAKMLRRLMTSKHLIIVASPALPEDIWDLLQSEFDVIVRLQRRWLETTGVNPHTAAKVMVWSLSMWKRIVLLSPNTMVVRNCDELFMESSAHNSSDDNSVMVVQPSKAIWTKLVQGMDGWSIIMKGEQRLNENELFSKVLGQEGLGLLAEKFCTKVDLRDGLLAKNLSELAIVQFTTAHPMEVLSKNELGSVFGVMESAIMLLWKDNLDHGVIQQLVRLGTNHFNGLKTYLDQYTADPVMIDSALEKDDQANLLREVKDSIAIIGMSCRFPGANTLSEFWKLLIEGGDGICYPPENRWAPDKCPVLPEDSKNSQAGFLSCSIDDFDAKFFGVSPMELEYMDPQQRLTLQVAWEALEDAGINPASLQSTYTGVFGGAWRTDYREALQNNGVGEDEFLRSYLGNSLGVLTARISHTLGLTGPSIGTESGCSSSIVAVDLACKSLLRRETSLSLACGVNLLIRPFTGKTMHTVLAPDGHCKTFDALADGFGRAEGCGVLVLKRYSDAVRDNDRVWGIIRGSAVVQEGPSRSLGTPTKYCEALAMSMALKEAGVQAKDVSYVETHGTGTPVGDPIEVAAIAEVYSQNRKEALTIGSVKTNIGHTESCSGIAGIIKVVLSMHNEMIPPHVNFTSLNPAINLDSIPARIPLEPTEWKRDATGRRHRIAGVSSFGITGTDAHTILQETPTLVHPSLLGGGSKRPLHVLTLSAKTEEALEDSLKQFKEFLKTTDERLQDISHTANIGRGQFLHRAALVGKDNVEILANLKNGNVFRKVAPEKAPKICFLFTGQGSQYPGMGRELYEHSLVFKTHFDQCDVILNKEYGINIKDALWGKDGTNLCRSIYSQTAIFCIEYCLLQLWAFWGVKPDYVLGHSLGEFAAALAAGILTFGDALKLVAERSRLIESLPQGRMLVVKECKDRVDILLKAAFQGTDRWLDYAAVNSPEQTVLAGSKEHIRAFDEFCKNNQIKTHVLASTHAFHSRHMDPILKEYRTVAESVAYSPPQNNGPVYVSGMEGRVVEEHAQLNADYWVQHTRDGVMFSSAVKDVLSRGCSLFLEIGPQPILSALTMINSDGLVQEGPVLCLPSIRKQEGDWSSLLSTVGKLFVSGISLNWEQFDQFESLKKTSIPFYPFQNKGYWFDVPDRGLLGIKIHPLVGTPISNASAMKLFENPLGLDSQPFLKDHMIGNRVIFPGAGFMEMCLVAGHSATQCPDNAYYPPNTTITLTDFVIESPLGLSESEAAHLQTIVSLEDSSGDTKINIYSRLQLDKETQKWIRHASATFSPYPSVLLSSKGQDQDPIILVHLLAEFQHSTEDVAGRYGKLAEFGLKFGPTFQTLEKMSRKTADDDGEALFHVRVTLLGGKFVCHPVLMDALFQAVMISGSHSSVSSSLHVPVSVQRFTVYASLPEDAETAYIYCKRGNTGEIRATLMTLDGTLIAQMEGAMLIETTVGAIMSALEAQKLSLPAMYEDVWRTQVGPMEKRADLLHVFNYDEVFGEPLLAELTKKHNQLSQEELNFKTKSYHLYALYMIKCLSDLGISPSTFTPGMELVVVEFVTKYKILPGLEGFVRYILFELEKEGYFRSFNKESKETLSFKLVKELPNPENVKDQIESLYNLVHPLSPNEIEYVSSTGTKLAALLTGKDSALSYLFPEDPSAVSAESYYITAKVSICVHSLMSECLGRFLKDAPRLLEENKQMIRLLEVGAGTGSFTKGVLNDLEGSAAHWEYTYTDLSPIFLSMGQKLFEKSKFKIHYKILNIEEDVATQGFFPGHYDMIIANLVIHATKNVFATVRNLKNLLREDGVLLVVEGLTPIRGTVLTFGLLDAYWHYEHEDFQLRGYNSEISQEKWELVLASAGYEQVVCYPGYEDKMGFIIAKNGSKGQVYRVPEGVVRAKLEKAWLVFTEDGPLSAYIPSSLASLGNQVILIRKSICYEKVNNYEFGIRPDQESDMIQLIQTTIKDSGVGLEGVVYLWGLLPQSVEGDVNPVVQPFLHLCKSIISFDSPKLFVVTKSVLNVGDLDLAPPTSSPLFAMAKCFQNEHHGATTRVIDLDDSVQISKEQLKEVFSELISDDQEIYVAYRGGQRIIPRLLQWKPQNKALGFPKSEKFRLILPTSNAINDLRFGPLSTKVLGHGEVEVRVRSYALNFRDVFVVLKPSAEFESMNSLGIDWSGVVTSVGPNVDVGKVKMGDAVFGINLNGIALASHINVHQDVLVAMPDSMTFNEAATIPAVAATAYICLVEVAKLGKDDTILIHTASGGVGLVAVQIAQHVGATIVATAGNKRKRAYLRNLGIQHVFHSRNITYESEIRTALGGRGVDVVLNSLTSPGFKEASLQLCNQGGRFVEMSKLNTWTVDEVTTLRPDVSYTIVDVSAASEQEIKAHLSKVADYMRKEIIKPIPYTRFDASDIREALTFLQKAKHIGKIVVVMPKDDHDQDIPLFNERSTYLITGGLGGIGMELAKWMLSTGAKNIALVGRSVPNDKAAEEIQRMNQRGGNVVALQCDVGDEGQCRELVDRLNSRELGLPQLRGIMHAAGVLSDSIYQNQTWEKYMTTYNPKVRGGWNLHNMTKQLPLEHFVMFSSAVASFGSTGQSNHSSANFFLDSLAHYRYFSGLPATTINWGQWGQVGVAANMEISGVRSFSALQGISALEKVMKSQRLQVCVCDADFGILRQFLSGVKRYFEELKFNQTSEGFKDLSINNEQFWNEFDSAGDDEARLEIVKRLVRAIIRQILKLEKEEEMNDDDKFQDLGMDSLMMIEMKNIVQSSVGKRAAINANSVKDCNTVNQLTIRLCQLLSGGDNNEEQIPTPTREELLKVTSEETNLS